MSFSKIRVEKGGFFLALRPPPPNDPLNDAEGNKIVCIYSVKDLPFEVLTFNSCYHRFYVKIADFYFYCSIIVVIGTA